jgi:hypothetical protein
MFCVLNSFIYQKFTCSDGTPTRAHETKAQDFLAFAALKNSTKKAPQRTKKTPNAKKYPENGFR